MKWKTQCLIKPEPTQKQLVLEYQQEQNKVMIYVS